LTTLGKEDDLARIFWDTNLFIYLSEDHPVLADRLVDLRQRMVERGDQLFTSALTVGELLAGPVSRSDTELVDRYQAFFSGSDLTVVPFDLKAAPCYASVRRDRGIQRPDAIQLACAAAARVDLFITNDSRLSRKVIPGIHFISGLERAPL